MLDIIGHKTQNEDKQNKKNFNTENKKYEQHRPHQKNRCFTQMSAKGK